MRMWVNLTSKVDVLQYFELGWLRTKVKPFDLYCLGAIHIKVYNGKDCKKHGKTPKIGDSAIS